MATNAPPILRAVQAVAEYTNTRPKPLTLEHAQILAEIQRRLTRLECQAAELMEINDRIWAKDGLRVDFDQATDTIVFSIEGIEQRLKLNRADPSVPTQMKSLTAGGAYDAGNSQPADDEEARLQIELEAKLESYYQSAHRVLKLFGRIPDLKKIKCDAVSRVRNELIEHPDDDALYSFGVGSTGPRVKPMHRGTPKFNDEGLVPNTLAFVDAIVAGCRGVP